MQPHRATLILVLGILGLVLSCVPLGIAAWLMGNTDLRLMAAGQMDPTGRDTTNVGKILGIIGVALFAVMLVVFGVMFVVVGFGAAASSHMQH